jgi:protein involved in polysaccharide export with SLBB domain
VFPMTGRSAHIEALYSTYLRNPQVDVGFAFDNSPGSVSPWGSVTVLGRVKTEGSINMPPTQDLTVSRAIQQSGGFNTSANISSITVTRRNPDGSVRHMEVDLRALRSRGELGQDLKLEPGDVVFVPEEVF